MSTRALEFTCRSMVQNMNRFDKWEVGQGAPSKDDKKME